VTQVAWTPINEPSELEALDKSICWEDSRLFESYTTDALAPGLPSDVNRTGYINPNLYVLIDEACHKRGMIELAFLHVDYLGTNALEHLHLQGTIDSLKRIEVRTHRDELLLRCARLAFRYPDWVRGQTGYYQRPWSSDEESGR